MGYNYRMSNIAAAIGRGQLWVLDERVEARRAIFQRYYDALSGIEGINFMPEAPYGRSNRWLTVMTLDPAVCQVAPMEVIRALEAENIESRPVWKPMHLQPLFQGCRYFTHEEGNSVSDELFATGVCLPSGSSLTEEEQERVVDCVRRCVKRINPTRKIGIGWRKKQLNCNE